MKAQGEWGAGDESSRHASVIKIIMYNWRNISMGDSKLGIWAQSQEEEKIHLQFVYWADPRFTTGEEHSSRKSTSAEIWLLWMLRVHELKFIGCWFAAFCLFKTVEVTMFSLNLLVLTQMPIRKRDWVCFLKSFSVLFYVVIEIHPHYLSLIFFSWRCCLNFIHGC